MNVSFGVLYVALYRPTKFVPLSHLRTIVVLVCSVGQLTNI